jgi:hypothetical protein
MNAAGGVLGVISSPEMGAGGSVTSLQAKR